MATKREFVKQVYDNRKFMDFFGYLYGRWQDEKEYEDINEYVIPVQKSYPNAFKAFKRPFGFAFHCDDGDVKIVAKRKGRYLNFVAEDY